MLPRPSPQRPRARTLDGLQQAAGPPRALRARYELSGRVLGAGQSSSGGVLLGTARASGRSVAVKMIEKGSPEGREAACAEVSILRSLGAHTNVVQLLDCFETEENYYIVLECAEGGDLLQRLLRAPSGALAEESAREFVAMVAGALIRLHARGIVHRDLKLENLLCASDEDTPSLKLADFGLARKLELPPLSSGRTEHHYSGSHLTDPCGTPAYAAPEVVGMVGYGLAIDCWSLGVVAHTLLCGEEPFSADTSAELFEQIKAAHVPLSGPRWQHISAEAKAVVRGLLTPDPRKRLTAAKLLEAPWFLNSAAAREARALAVADEAVLRRSAGWKTIAHISQRFQKQLSFSVEAVGSSLASRFVKVSSQPQSRRNSNSGAEAASVVEKSDKSDKTDNASQLTSMHDSDSVGDFNWQAGER
ncbi:kinase-like domain-containing protein [Pavlovales sp. CCMP2436]|nr:kinase-like domain-containing protein [Pavlovales sp. CCMP2436]